MSQATIKPTPPAPVTLAEFDEIFAAVKNWGRWGTDDELGTLNYITADTVRAAAATVRSGRRATMAIAMNTAAGPDNPSPVTHHVVQGHDIDIGSSGVTFCHGLRRAGLPRRLPHAHGRALPHRLPGPGL